jgi:serine/threonine protein phosphatase 1
MADGAIVVGDIHGDVRRLDALLARLDLKNRELVFVGDYVDRGPDSRSVLNILCGLKRALCDRVVFLAGNHDLAFLRYLRDGNLARFAALGGIATLRSYVTTPVGDLLAAVLGAIPSEHIAFLEALVPAWHHGEHLISHTGFDPDHPNDRSMGAMAERSHPKMFERTLDFSVVCGHYVQRDRVPKISNRLLCIDTGCGTVDGPLTALLLPERSFVQA